MFLKKWMFASLVVVGLMLWTPEAHQARWINAPVAFVGTAYASEVVQQIEKDVSWWEHMVRIYHRLFDHKPSAWRCTSPRARPEYGGQAPVMNPNPNVDVEGRGPRDRVPR